MGSKLASSGNDRPDTDGARPRLPSWLLIGAPKAGTTAFAGWLGQHPQAYLSEEKELYFFDDHWSKGMSWYEDQFAPARPGALAGEATPSYLYSDEALRRIRDTVPDVRLLVLLRDPAKRAWSQFLFTRQMGEEMRSFVQAIEDELSDPGALPWPRRVPGYVGGGFYTERIRKVQELFGPDALLALFQEELVADPLGTYAAACTHIGLDPSFVPELRRENPTYDVRSVRAQRAIWTLWRQRPTRKLARGLSRLNGRGGSSSPMPADVDRRLRVLYREDGLALEQALGRKLPAAWRRDGD